MKGKGFFITGTDTGVGKTVVTACLVSLFRKYGRDVGVMKPVETGVDPECSSAANSDAKFLQEVAGVADELEEVCPIRLKPAASPWQAARMENRSVDVEKILRTFRNLSARHPQMLVEGIGGLLVPLTRDYLVADLICDLGLPAIVVSRTALGTLNHTLLTLRAARDEGIEVRGVILNHPEKRDKDAIEREQAGLITELSGIPVIGECPYIDSVSTHGFVAGQLAEIEEGIPFQRLVQVAEGDLNR